MFGKSKTKVLEEQVNTIQDELIQTKKQLEEYKTLFSAYLRQHRTNGYILHVSPNGVIINAMGAIFNVFGYTIGQIVGKRLSEITNSEDKKKVQDCLCRELSFQGNIRRLSSNGVKTVQSFAHVIKEDASIIFTEWDITNMIGSTKTNIHYIINALPHMAYIKDSDGIFCTVNTKFAEACQKDVDYFENRGRIQGNNLLFQTLHSNDKDMQTNANDETVSFEIEWPDKIVRNVTCECCPISSINKGNFQNYKQPLYLHIITESECTTDIQDGTHGAHFRCTYIDNEFTITYSTNNLLEIIGNDTDFVKCIHKDDLEMFYYSLDKIAKSAHPWKWQGRVCVNNTIKRLNIIAWPVVAQQAGEMLGMVQDLTSETYEKRINSLIMRHTSDVIALHSFENGIKPSVKFFSHSVKTLLGYDDIQNDHFWKLHPDDSVIIQEILFKMKQGIADTSVYRIKHNDNYWVKVKTEFIPFDTDFITITTKV